MRTRLRCAGGIGLFVLLSVICLLRPGPGMGQSAPVLDTGPHNGGYRGPALCANACFDATAAYSTPAYVSLDVPRSATLFYSSALAHPVATVQADAGDSSPTPPAKMSVRLKRADGSWVTFTTGTQEVFYESDAGTSRLAAQFDASGLATGAYKYTVVVRSWRSNGTFAESTAPVRVLVRNERNSALGAGWSLAGLQEAHPQADGSVVVTEGAGAVAFFQKDGSRYVSPPGDFSTLTHDGTDYRRSYPGGTRVHFYSNGRQEYVQDRFGNRTEFRYSSGRPYKITDPAGKIITFSYGSDGKLASIKDAAGRTTTLTINSWDNLKEIQDPAGGSPLRDATYDEEHRLKHYTDRRGGAWGFAYDDVSKLAADTTPAVTADGGGTRLVTRFRSWERDLLPFPGKGTSSNPTSRKRPGDLRAEITNPRGKTTQLGLNRFGAPTRIEEPLGRLTQFSRNADNQVTRATTPSGHQTDYTWNGPTLTQVYDRTTGRTVHLEYEPAFHQVKRVYGDIAPQWNYWSAGKLDSTRVGSGTRPASRFTYDARGRLRSATSPKGHVSRAFYDGGNAWMNTDSVVAPGKRRSKFGYDGAGRGTSATDPANGVRRAGYDAINRALRSVGALNDTTLFTYDALFPTRVRDAKLQAYGVTPNALGWATADTDPNTKQRRYRYDKNGNLTSWTNRRGQIVRFTYDDLDQLRSRTADGKTTTYSTDPKGRFVVASNAESTDTLRFDPLGRVTHQITVRGGKRYVLQSSYDKRNLRTQLRMTSPWTRTIQYRYNAEMQLDTLIDLAGGRTRLSYDDDRRRASIRLPTGMTISLGYPSTGRPGSIRYSVDAVDDAFGLGYRHGKRGEMRERLNVFGDSTRGYQYDAHGQLTRFTDYRNSSPSCTWSQDEGQLCSYGSQTLLKSEAYAYDKVGNPTHQGAVVATGNRLTRINGYKFEYDADGNVTRKYKVDRNGNPVDAPENIDIYWNSLNQIDSIYTYAGGGFGYMEYDGFGRRTRKQGNGATFVYLYDGDNFFSVLDGQGKIRQEFTHYPGVDRPHSVRTANGNTYYTMTDFPGSVAGTVNGSNQVVERVRYKPFGEFESQSIVVNPLAYMGWIIDEAGTYYARNRWYDPDLERFLSEDPIGLAGGINLYRFTGNGPTNYRDPYGLDPCQNGATVIEDGGVCEIEGVTVTVSGGGGGFQSGFSSNFGNRGYGGGAFSGGSTGFSGFGGGGGGGFGASSALSGLGETSLPECADAISEGGPRGAQLGAAITTPVITFVGQRAGAGLGLGVGSAVGGMIGAASVPGAGALIGITLGGAVGTTSGRVAGGILGAHIGFYGGTVIGFTTGVYTELIGTCILGI